MPSAARAGAVSAAVVAGPATVRNVTIISGPRARQLAARGVLPAFLAAWPAIAGCSAPAPVDEASCLTDKCDLPDGEDPDLCALRRADAFNENQLAFTEGFLRWSCNDVD